ncbi:MAG: xanthine dehydrogenase family protein [Acidobacteria bacterium]|nr:xanthine dehydrogenase family protein [Acidobacteriota bacterium]
MAVNESMTIAPSVGQSVLRREGRDKLTGEARYVDDWTFPGLWFGRTVRSSICHGEIEAIEFDPAFDWSRVTVADYRDIPGRNVVALIEEDQPLLAEKRVHHREEPILLLAAPDREWLEAAARQIRIRYREWPAVLTIEDALAGGEARRGIDNLLKEYHIERGDVDEGLRQSAHVLEGEYRVGHQEQLYIENNGVIAFPPSKDGSTRVMGSMQCPYYVHRALKTILDLDDEKIIVQQTVTGGGFGGKEEYPNMICGHAAILARKTGHPVKIIYDRGEDLAATPKRHPAVIRIRSGVASDGRLEAMDVDIVMDGGAYATLSAVVLSRAAIHAIGPYRCPNVRIRARALATNTPPNGAFRGFGVPQACFAEELHLDRIAAAIGLDPVTIRRKNLVREGDVTATGQTLRWSVGAEDVLEEAVRRSKFEELHRQYQRRTGGSKRRGIGLSLFMHGIGFTGSGEEKLKSISGVELLPDGRVKVLTAATEIGQGTRTIFCQIAADTIGIPYDSAVIEEPDTSRVPDSGPTVASRTCMITGSVVAEAARELREKLVAFAGADLGIPGAVIKGGMLYDPAGDQRLSFSELASQFLDAHRELRTFSRYQRPPGVHWNDETYSGDAYAVFSYAADVIEVEVDLDTFETTVLKVTTAQDIGTPIHPKLAEGQIEGGTLQAIGYGLLEEVVMHGGRMVNDRLTNYIIPTSLDAPEIETVLVGKPYPYGPFGAKGVGELPIDGAAPALASAIYNATGALVTELPITPERLEQACRLMHRSNRK